MADFKTPSLAGASSEFNEVLGKFDSIKGEVVAGLELDASALAATLNTSVLGDLTSKLKNLVPELPELPNVNLQSEMSSLLDIDQGTLAGQLEFATKQAELKTKFGEGLTAGGFDLDTLVTSAESAQTAALTATSNLTSATSALASAKETATSSLDTAIDASLKYDRSNIPNPTAIVNDLTSATSGAVSAVSAEGIASTAFSAAKGTATRIQDVVPNFEVLAAGGVAFQKASSVLQATGNTVKEKVSIVVSNSKLDEDIKAKAAELKEFVRDAPKVLPTEDKGAYAVAKKSKEISITATPEEGAVDNTEVSSETQEDGATIIATVTTASDGSKKITTNDGGETVIRYNVAPHGFSRRPQSTLEKITKSSTKDSPSTITTETRTWTDSNGNSGTVKIDIIILADKPIEIVNVRGRAAGKRTTRRVAAAGSRINYKDVYSIDKNGRILIGWADSNGNPPLPDGTFTDGIWVRQYQYDATGAKADTITGKKEEWIYKVNYRTNENYDPTFNGNVERAKDKGNPKQARQKVLDLIVLNKRIQQQGGTEGVVEAISVVNFSGQKQGVYKHANGKEYTILSATIESLYNAIASHAPNQ